MRRTYPIAHYHRGTGIALCVHSSDPAPAMAAVQRAGLSVTHGPNTSTSRPNAPGETTALRDYPLAVKENGVVDSIRVRPSRRVERRIHDLRMN